MSSIEGKFISPEVLSKMTLPEIKKHVRELNEHYGIKGYSKLKKDQLVNAIGTAQMRIKKGNTKPTVTSAPKREKKAKSEHPKGIHIHINWKTGKPALKTYKTLKEGEKAFKTFRKDRKTVRDYRSMKLMDGEKILDYSA